MLAATEPAILAPPRELLMGIWVMIRHGLVSQVRAVAAMLPETKLNFYALMVASPMVLQVAVLLDPPDASLLHLITVVP